MRFIGFILTLFIFSTFQINAQGWAKKGLKFQKQLDSYYSDATTSPLPPEDVSEFRGHPFFAPNKKFKVKAAFKRTPNEKPFQMPTSTDRLPIYTLYGIATFIVDGKSYSLNVYQNKKYTETLFLPFYDLTSGESTYGGGRYLDLKYPKRGKIKLDFNMAYHPYCAYSDKYSCPIPPVENRLDLEILA